ncbi:hypothetical protein COY32_02535 [candidate division WWE3 bacterium CG_4_10_14_0_2_um_filter_41_14]|uniref:histidine kinase n=1 Tax=candidate division WWE3 bacterium CG_4_10_14_0_2_um_filter_41_14 TaxID=1975072 RepID=A0A2M7TJZ0_UNCKA|nr:MAG: hypothetical protein COY32_02535 [candidate division WWE3 bacterium CG_4_10_14_0_2_um_filter_41_14]
MNIALIQRYRKNIEISIWILILGIGLFVNLVELPAVKQSKELLNLLIILIISFTLVYYRIIAPRWSNIELILTSILIYTVFIFTIIHFTGSFQSVLFSLIFVPILITALMLGVEALAIVVAGEIFWLFSEYFLYFAPTYSNVLGIETLLWEKLIAVLLVSFMAYDNSKEIFKRQNEHELLEIEKNTIRKLQEREETILQSMKDIVVALDITGNILTTNKAFTDTIGKQKSEMLGKNYTEFFSIEQLDNVNEVTQIIDINATPLGENDISELSASQEINYRLTVNQTNKQLLVSITISALHEADQIAGKVLVIRDITETQQLERMKLDFVSMAAHELRTPITAIRGYLSALKEEARPSLSEEHNKFLDRADIAANQLTTLMENLLSVSRIEKGSFNLDLRKTDWIHLMDQRVEELMNRATERNLTLTWQHPDADVPEVLVDPLRVSEVLNNLISNAINYTPAGSVTITVEYDSAKEMVITHITDTGQGIPTEAQNHLFEKFFRVSGILEQGSKGTGLGLYISKEIIELHHGEIWVESKEGSGSTFSFSIPTIHNLTIRDGI